MGRAIITLVDDTDGKVELKVTFEGGYNKNSHSHGQAAMMIMHMDELAKQSEAKATEQAQTIINDMKFPTLILP